MIGNFQQLIINNMYGKLVSRIGVRTWVAKAAYFGFPKAVKIFN